MRRVLAGTALIGALGCVACGSAATPQAPAWAATHSGNAILAFDTSAPGICALTVRYGDEAPAAIEYGGSVFVQVGKDTAASPSPGATSLDNAGGWNVVRTSATTLILFTKNARYDYKVETTC